MFNVHISEQAVVAHDCHGHRYRTSLVPLSGTGSAPVPLWRFLAANYYEQAFVGHRAIRIGSSYFVLVRCHSRIRSATTAGVLRIEAYSYCIV